MSDCVIRSRVDPNLKTEANQIFQAMGLTMSDAIRIFLYRVVSSRAIPFQLEIPNAETIAAMETADRGEWVETVTLDDIIKQWNEA